MKIRGKLLILLLIIALLPLIVLAVVNHISMHRLGGNLAADTRRTLAEEAEQNLRLIVGDYGVILNRDKQMLELMLTCQAKEVERRLAADPPTPPRRLYFVEDYDKGVDMPLGMVSSEKHYRPGRDDKLVPIRVTYNEQVYLVVEGVDKKTIADDMARLSTMPEVYQLLYDINPDAMYWQYTALESGFHSSYPGKGGYPANYDPRKRQWYKEAKENGSLTWGIMIDATTRTVTITASMPVYRPDGSFAGVTAIDVWLNGIFKDLKLPAHWSEVAEIKIISTDDHDGDFEGKPLIIFHKSYQKRKENWQSLLELAVLKSEDHEQLEALVKDASAGRTDVKRMRYRGRDSLWAYGAAGDDKPFPLVIVPYDIVVAHAAMAEDQVLEKTIGGLKLTGIILLGVVIIVVILAFRSANSVTNPISQLAEAAERIARGRYDTHVDIQTGDELQELGEIFNDMLPKLSERHRKKE